MQDGVLSDSELNDFQVHCFAVPLQPEELSGVKTVVLKGMREVTPPPPPRNALLTHCSLARCCTCHRRPADAFREGPSPCLTTKLQALITQKFMLA